MISLVRVDDRLIHGQVLCAWVPHVEADLIVLVTEVPPEPVFIGALSHLCSDDGIKVLVMKAAEAAEAVSRDAFHDDSAIFIMNTLEEAVLLYEAGYRFGEINIGNIHHNGGGRQISKAVSLNADDERILNNFVSLGVKIDIRALPNKDAVEFIAQGDK